MKIKLYNHSLTSTVALFHSHEFYQEDQLIAGGEAYIEHDGKIYIYYDTVGDEIQYREGIRAVLRTEDQ